MTRENREIEKFLREVQALGVTLNDNLLAFRASIYEQCRINESLLGKIKFLHRRLRKLEDAKVKLQVDVNNHPVLPLADIENKEVVA